MTIEPSTLSPSDEITTEMMSMNEAASRDPEARAGAPSLQEAEGLTSSTSMDELRVDVLADLLARASAAPWSVDVDPRLDGADQITDVNGLTVAFMSTPAEDAYADAELIAELRNAAPALLAALTSAEKRIASLTEELECLREFVHHDPECGQFKPGCTCGLADILTKAEEQTP